MVFFAQYFVISIPVCLLTWYFWDEQKKKNARKKQKYKKKINFHITMSTLDPNQLLQTQVAANNDSEPHPPITEKDSITGVITQTNSDGSTTTFNVDGSTTTTYLSGESVTTYPNNSTVDQTKFFGLKCEGLQETTSKAVSHNTQTFAENYQFSNQNQFNHNFATNNVAFTAVTNSFANFNLALNSLDMCDKNFMTNNNIN